MKNLSLQAKYSLIGILIGTATIVGVWTLRFFLKFFIAEDVSALSDWLILVSPVFLAIIGWYIGKSLARRIDGLQSQITSESNKAKLVAKLAEDLNKSDVSLDLDGIDLEEEVKSSLINLKESILETREEESKRLWVTEGIAHISDVLRSGRDNLSELCDNLISNLVKHLNANQGGLFLVNEEKGESVLELASCYAYERKKFLEKTIQPGQGLVGQTYLEQEKILLKVIPEDYTSITSGLGGATPSNLVLFPLKVEEKVYGVLEIGSFKAFEDRHLEFLDRISEIVASTISSIQINENTRSLLDDAKDQTEQMRVQEEVMRQSMEELAATQEDGERKEKELQKVLRELKDREIGQQVTEISLAIQSSLENAKKELQFLKHTPPVQGILRARANDGVDPVDSSTEDDWIGRLQVILENLLITKGLYKKMLFTDSKNDLITGVISDGISTNLASKDVVSSKERIQSNWEEDTIYVANPSVNGHNDFHIEMHLPVYVKEKYEGCVSLSIPCAPLIAAIKKREDRQNKFFLLDGSNNTLYTATSQSATNGNVREEIVINEIEKFSLHILHVPNDD